MRQRFLITFAALVMACFTASPAAAVNNGQADGSGHPYVGVAIQPIPDMPGYVWVCTGAALSSTRFLTAAHCFEAGQPVYVSYETSGAHVLRQGTFHPDPDWCIGCGPGLPGFDTHDVAVITLASPATLPRYAQLPAKGLVDDLEMGTPVDIVGYGVRRVHTQGKPLQDLDWTRYYAPSLLVASNHRTSTEFIKLSANPAKGKGGTCFGDSGGPDLLGGTDIVLAVNSYVTNGNCAGVTYSNRVDTKAALDFINSY